MHIIPQFCGHKNALRPWKMDLERRPKPLQCPDPHIHLVYVAFRPVTQIILTVCQGFPTDKLTTYRHLLGIYSASQSSRVLGGNQDHSHNPLHFDGRFAPNLGIYQRVVHREQQAKKGYKSSALLINSCLGLQIIVAAALTAMGAANSSHRAITAFGAINTVIAGLLTYLKGSGLPNRIRYYESEWKRVREFIEQRERDFARPDCELDVYEVVRVIEDMYEEVKIDIQTNTPENYVSVGELRSRVQASTHPIPDLKSLGQQAASGPVGKLQELEMKYGHKVADVLENLSRKENDRLKVLEAGIGGQKRRLETEIEGGRSFLDRARADFGHEVEDGKAAMLKREADFEKDVGSSVEAQRRSLERSATEMTLAFEARKEEVARQEAEHERRIQAAVEAQRKDLERTGTEFTESLKYHKDDATRKEVEYERQLQAQIDSHKAELEKRELEIQAAVDAQKIELAGREAQLMKDLDLKAAHVADAEREAAERKANLVRIGQEAQNEITRAS